jgi:hypothetical protein
MARYFKSFGAGRPLELGGRSFVFEPVMPMGGGWLGVLVETDEVSASILSSNADRVSEITEAQYNELKKKRSGRGTTPASRQSQTPRPSHHPLVQNAVLAGRPPGSAGTEKKGPAKAEEIDVGPSVTLGVTDQEPPPEPLLDNAPKKQRKG